MTHAIVVHSGIDYAGKTTAQLHLPADTLRDGLPLEIVDHVEPFPGGKFSSQGEKYRSRLNWFLSQNAKNALQDSDTQAYANVSRVRSFLDTVATHNPLTDFQAEDSSRTIIGGYAPADHTILWTVGEEELLHRMMQRSPAHSLEANVGLLLFQQQEMERLLKERGEDFTKSYDIVPTDGLTQLQQAAVAYEIMKPHLRP